MKDIFIDNNIAKNFAHPADDHYKNLLKWLLEYDQEGVAAKIRLKQDFAHLIVNNKLLREYCMSSYNCRHNTSIGILIDRLTKEGRLIKINNQQIKTIENQLFTKTFRKKILSNEEDHCHICTIYLSYRKMVLTYDVNFTNDLKKLNGINVIVSDRPEDINYR